MKAPMFIPNPMRGETAIAMAAQLRRTIAILLGAVISAGILGAALVYFFVELPLLAGVLLLMEVAFAVFVRLQYPRLVAARHRDLVVAGSYLSGIEINQFAQPQQLWDAAVAVRDSGDKARVRMILGS